MNESDIKKTSLAASRRMLAASTGGRPRSWHGAASHTGGSEKKMSRGRRGVQEMGSLVERKQLAAPRGRTSTQRLALGSNEGPPSKRDEKYPGVSVGKTKSPCLLARTLLY